MRSFDFGRLDPAGRTSLWIPSLGGRFDPENTVHDLAMTITGGSSKSERQHVQRRVRAAMAAQVLIDGKHQGGRAPYGYVVVDAGPHPNPRKAQEGYRLRVLAIDEVAAPVVERIFALYLDGVGLKGTAEILNRDGVLCPSAHTPRQNRHRRGDGWQHATVKAILENPRYTGYAIYGRWQKVEELLDPDDVAAGHIVRFRRSAQSKIVRSREPAHPAIVSVEVFTRVQLEMRARRGSDMAARASQPRTRVGPKASYLFRGTIRCETCGRRMEGAPRTHAMFYRCAARTLVPGSSAALGHPPTVYVREDHLSDGVNEWIAGPFSPANLDQTVALLTGAQSDEDPADAAERTFRQRIATADATMTRLERVLEAGWDPEALAGQYNAAVAEKKAALTGLEPAERLSTADTRAMVEKLLVVAVVWFVFFRSGPKRVAVLGVRMVLLVGVVVLTIPLAVEYANTRRRRPAIRPGRSPPRRVTSPRRFRSIWLMWIGGWPRRSTRIGGGGGRRWKAYSWWQDFEHWAGGDTGVAVPDKEAVPILVGRKSEVLLSTSAAHAGQIARVSPVGQEKRAVQVLLDRQGNALIHLTRSNAGMYVRGGVYLIQAKGGRVLVRLQ